MPGSIAVYGISRDCSPHVDAVGKGSLSRASSRARRIEGNNFSVSRPHESVINAVRISVESRDCSEVVYRLRAGASGKVEAVVTGRRVGSRRVKAGILTVGSAHKTM